MNKKLKDAFHKTTTPVAENLEKNKSMAEKIAAEIDANLRRNAARLSDEAVKGMSSEDFKIWRESLHQLSTFVLSSAVLGEFFTEVLNSTFSGTSKAPK